MGKIKVIIKRPDEKIGHVTYISDTLENMQKTVGGRIEVIQTGIHGALILCDEESKLKNYPANFRLGGKIPDIVAGTVFVCGHAGPEFTDVPISLFQWRSMLDLWGNEVD